MKKKLTFLLHIHPQKVSRASIRFTYTYGLGGMTLTLILLQIFTGILLKFVYIPSPEKAYDSILFLQDKVLFGKYVRNIHHLSGELLIVLALLHMLRVFFTEAFHPPVRSSNWIIGICMFLLIMFFNFTGYLMPWDQLSYWAVTVVTNMFSYIPLIGNSITVFIRGGQDVTGNTLRNFFTFHTAIIPLTLVILMIFHFWKIRKAGGVAPPRVRKEDEKGLIPTVPNLVVKEIAAGLILLAFVFILAIFLNAPLRERANPAYSPNPVKAPWYFIGIQEMLMHFHPFVGAILIPLFLLGFLFYLPWLHYPKNNAGFWFSSPKGRKMVIFSVIFAFLLNPLLIVSDEYLIHFNLWFPSLPSILSEGLFPVLLYGFFFYLYLLSLRKKYDPSTNETVQAIYAYFLITYTVLSLTGLFFRGPGMALMWPWQI
ncbi:MAG TPA: DUF4405 domain-containing protein [Bacteroidetes bacterium]|nr:DUF4405 domain-containing protein [Bacteroidota bacterium]